METLQAYLHKYLKDEDITYTSDISGGIVNKAALFESGNQQYFVKYNEDENARCLFESERESLQLMEKIGIIRVPKSIQVLGHPNGRGGIHVLEYIGDLKPLENHWSTFGEQIARLHKYNVDLLTSRSDVAEFGERDNETTGVTRFGFHVPPYMGLFTPGAVWRDTWQEYFIEDILGALINLLMSKYNTEAITEYWSIVKPKLGCVFERVDIKPTLLHGDFCPANFGETSQGPVIFDHSCMYGHSEFEFVIAINEGGVPDKFFEKYHEIIPKVDGHEKRLQVYSLFYNIIMWYHIDSVEWKERTLASFKAVIDLLT